MDEASNKRRAEEARQLVVTRCCLTGTVAGGIVGGSIQRIVAPLFTAD